MREEKTLDLGKRYQLLSDAAVVPGSERDYASTHPKSAVLVAEASDTSVRYDRVVKSHRYAQAGIADYWIINLSTASSRFIATLAPTLIGPDGFVMLM